MIELEQTATDSVALAVMNAGRDIAALELKRLKELNAELVAALDEMVRYDDLPEAEQAPAMSRARAVIIKARQ